MIHFISYALLCVEFRSTISVLAVGNTILNLLDTREHERAEHIQQHITGGSINSKILIVKHRINTKTEIIKKETK